LSTIALNFFAYKRQLDAPHGSWYDEPTTSRQKVIILQDHKTYSPYHGVWAVVLMLSIVPIALTWVIGLVLAVYQPHMSALNTASARFVGCGLGSIFHLACIIGGLLRDSFHTLCFRISEFFANLACSVSFAFQSYWDDMKQDGVVFDIYLLIILLTLANALYNLQVALKLLHFI